MDRFFSKLDLRDIKIDPFKTSFPPDTDDDDAPAEAVAEIVIEESSASDAWAARPAGAAWATQDEVGTEEADVVVEEAVVFVASDDLGDNGYVEQVVIASVVASSDAAESYEAGDVLKVSARSRPSAVAGAIAGVVRELGRAEVQAIGAGATNQAIKAVAIARDYLRETGIDAVCLPAFIDVTIDNEDRTAIRLVVEPR